MTDGNTRITGKWGSPDVAVSPPKKDRRFDGNLRPFLCTQFSTRFFVLVHLVLLQSRELRKRFAVETVAGTGRMRSYSAHP